MPKTSQNLMAGAGVLAVSGLIAKVLSAVYRVPFQNLVGNTGFYVYQQVYPIYGIGMVLALSGWPLFISKSLQSNRMKCINNWWHDVCFGR